MKIFDLNSPIYLQFAYSLLPDPTTIYNHRIALSPDKTTTTTVEGTQNRGSYAMPESGLCLNYNLEFRPELPLPESLSIRLDWPPPSPAIAVQDNNTTGIVLQELFVEIPFPYSPQARIFCNGFQSWTETAEFDLNAHLNPPGRLARHWLGAFGDYFLQPSTGKKGLLHGWNFGYIRQHEADCRVAFIGSTDNDQNGYTLLEFDMVQKLVRIKKSCAGLHLPQQTESNKVLRTWQAMFLKAGFGDEKAIFDTFFAELGRNSRQQPQRQPCLNAPQTLTPIAGWTSWYYYYTTISEKIVRDNLAVFAQHRLPLNIVQIDDGWQTFVGDWLHCNTKFGGKQQTLAANVEHSNTGNMRLLAADIKQQGYKAGLWLAPFICQHQSALHRQHPEWLLRDEKGRPVKAGYNVLWRSWMYVLDFYNADVRHYLKQVFDLILQQWGFDMVKLDFLYAVSCCPPPHKTQGQVQYEAMTFLREIVGPQKLILGCGVPLAGAVGCFDYCRIGPDVHTGWEMNLLKWLGSRERVSTVLTLKNTLARHWLNGRAFGNDPDVSILRSSKTSLSPQQRFTLFFINQALGGVQFVSDNIGEYDPPTLALYLSQFPLLPKTNLQVIAHSNDATYEIGFCIGQLRYIAICNLSAQTQHISDLNTLPPETAKGLLFDCRCRAYNLLQTTPTPTTIRLEPYETRYWVLTQTPEEQKAVAQSQHLFLGGEWAIDL